MRWSQEGVVWLTRLRQVSRKEGWSMWPNWGRGWRWAERGRAAEGPRDVDGGRALKLATSYEGKERERSFVHMKLRVVRYIFCIHVSIRHNSLCSCLCLWNTEHDSHAGQNRAALQTPLQRWHTKVIQVKIVQGRFCYINNIATVSKVILVLKVTVGRNLDCENILTYRQRTPRSHWLGRKARR